MPTSETLLLSKTEAGLAEKIAERYGISRDEAVSRLVKSGMDAMLVKRTGRGLAPVHKMMRGAKK